MPQSISPNRFYDQVEAIFIGKIMRFLRFFTLHQARSFYDYN